MDQFSHFWRSFLQFHLVIFSMFSSRVLIYTLSLFQIITTTIIIITLRYKDMSLFKHCYFHLYFIKYFSWKFEYTISYILFSISISDNCEEGALPSESFLNFIDANPSLYILNIIFNHYIFLYCWKMLKFAKNILYFLYCSIFYIDSRLKKLSR